MATTTSKWVLLVSYLPATPTQTPATAPSCNLAASLRLDYLLIGQDTGQNHLKSDVI